MIDEKIQSYAERYTSGEGPVLTELRELTAAERNDGNMLSGFYQGRLLAMISRMLSPNRVLEIGTYMGYSALCLAEGLAEGGKVITIDVDEETHRVARDFWEKAGSSGRIEGLLGNAVDLIPPMDELFDLIFIDADKENYSNYYDLVFPKLKIGGLLVADNVLWSGDVLNAEAGEDVRSSTRALHDYNVKVQADARVSNILLGVRDGLMVSRKETG